MLHPTIHTPVLLEEVLKYLDVKSDRDYIDATLGGGGYTREILKRNYPNGRVLALDLSEEAIERIREELKLYSLENWILKNKSVSKDPLTSSGSGSETRYPTPNINLGNRVGKPEPQQPGFGSASKGNITERLILENENFGNIKEAALSNNFNRVYGICFDLGLSKDILSLSGRGFSFESNEPLFMTFSKKQAIEGGKTAKDILNQSTQKELENIFKEYGEEKFSKQIAKQIVEERKKNRLKTTYDLREIIKRVVKDKPIKSLARIFQALRIKVNNELENLQFGLNGAWDILEKEGVIVVVSFNSLEDRIVKNFIKYKEKEGSAKILTPKPIETSKKEVAKNSSSRSAKLRAVRKL